MGGKRCTVIDYLIGNEEAKEEVVEMRVRNKRDSDHQPLEVIMRGKGGRRKEKGGRRVRRGVWDKEECEAFRIYLGDVKMGEKDLDMEKRVLEVRIKETIEEVEKERNKGRDRGKGE